MATIYCKFHNDKELRTGKSGRLFCPTPITRDSKGKVVEWCDYNPTNAPANTQPIPLPEAPTIPQERAETREPVPQDIPFKIRDFDAENRGKVRHGIIVARTEGMGVVPLLPDEVEVINQLVEFVMSGKLPELPEDIDIDLPSATSEGE